MEFAETLSVCVKLDGKVLIVQFVQKKMIHRIVSIVLRLKLADVEGKEHVSEGQMGRDTVNAMNNGRVCHVRVVVPAISQKSVLGWIVENMDIISPQMCVDVNPDLMAEDVKFVSLYFQTSFVLEFDT